MIVRFQTWCKADTFEECYAQLRDKCRQYATGEKIGSEVFTPVVLEKGEELTVRELFEWCLNHENCKGCKPQETGYECLLSPGMDIEVITSVVRGYKEANS